MTINSVNATMDAQSDGSLTKPGGPPWTQGATDLEWRRPAGNLLSSVQDPLAASNSVGIGPAGMVLDYTGASFGQRGICLPGQAGHSGYGGNEIMWWDHLSNDPAPQWERVRDATQSEPFSSGSWEEWPDGTPTADHGYTQIVDAAGRILKWGLGATNWLGSQSQMVWEVDPDTVPWTYVKHPGPWTMYGAENSSVCYDPATDNVVYVMGNNLRPAVQFAPRSTLAVGEEIPSVNSDINKYGVSAQIDTTNNYLIVVTTEPGLYVMDLTATASGFTKIIPTGTPPAGDEYDRNRYSWHVNALIMLDGNALHKLTPTDANWSGAAWGTIPTTGVFPPDLTGVGYFGKQGIIDVAGKVWLFAINRYGGGPELHALPLPDGGF